MCNSWRNYLSLHFLILLRPAPWYNHKKRISLLLTHSLWWQCNLWIWIENASIIMLSELSLTSLEACWPKQHVWSSVTKVSFGVHIPRRQALLKWDDVVIRVSAFRFCNVCDLMLAYLVPLGMYALMFLVMGFWGAYISIWQVLLKNSSCYYEGAGIWFRKSV